jgi:2-methylcitrate dehydratase PrpD
VKGIVVRVGTHDAMLVDNREIPTVCLQHMIAVMLLDKTISFKSAHDSMRMNDPAVLKQRAKVKLVHDDELERLLPNRVAVVELTMVDGGLLTERVEAVRGTAANPMTRAEITTKARDLIAPVLGTATCQKLIDKVFALENVKSILELRPLLQNA